MKSQAVESITKEIRVSLTPEAAFRLFTEGMSTWWPLDSHSVSGARARSVVCDGRSEGRIYEVEDDGTEHLWGTVIKWEPPSLFVFTWHPGRDSSSAQQVHVSFTPESEGTLVRLVHSGWEKLGEEAAHTRRGYDTGWDLVLGKRFGGEARRLRRSE
jgi:uncharacterized protein YndB with AHSA1/START domain